jgi:hypothetical protein
MIRLGLFFIISPISHSRVATRNAFILHSSFCLPSRLGSLGWLLLKDPIHLGLGEKHFGFIRLY